MSIKKKIKNYYDSIELPTAEKVLPETAKTITDIKKLAPVKRLIITLSAAVFCLFVLSAGMIIGLDSSEENSKILGDESVQTSEPIETTNSEDDSNVSNTESNVPSEILTIYTTPENGEFAGDMYRPDGYHINIGSALALMMHYTPDSDARFNVLIYTWDDVDIEDVILKINESISEDIPLEQLRLVEVEGDIFENLKRYHLYLNKEQINAFAENRVYCMYIGSGIGEYKDQNWETVEGIKTYCEIHGDMYTFDKQGILADPDIFPEDEN